MYKKYKSKNVTWVDVEKPTSEEVRDLMRKYKLHPLVAEELLMPTFKPKVDWHKEYIYLILHFPFFKRTEKGSECVNREVDFVIGKDFILTIRYESVRPLEQFSKVFEVNSILNTEEENSNHAGYLFFYLALKLYESLSNELDYLEARQREMKKFIFSGEEKRMVKEISRVSHNLLDFKQATVHHQEVLESLEIAGQELFGKDFTHHLRSINDKYRKISHGVKTNQESLKELRETNDSLLTTKQNESMKIFTILAFVTFPLSLIASLFGMNTVTTPIVGQENDFWWIIAGMFTATLIMFSFFKYKKWF